MECDESLAINAALVRLYLFRTCAAREIEVADVRLIAQTELPDVFMAVVSATHRAEAGRAKTTILELSQILATKEFADTHFNDIRIR